MSRRVLLGKAGSDYGLFISKIGVDVVNDSGTLCDKDLMIFDSREKLTNNFFVVANKKDEKKFITEGNKRVVEARLADAKFFWDKDRSKNLIKLFISAKPIGKAPVATFGIASKDPLPADISTSKFSSPKYPLSIA